MNTEPTAEEKKNMEEFIKELNALVEKYQVDVRAVNNPTIAVTPMKQQPEVVEAVKE